jgi:hypothetical protein
MSFVNQFTFKKSIEEFLLQNCADLDEGSAKLMSEDIFNDIIAKINSYINKLKDINNVALEFSDFNTIRAFLANDLSEETFQRVKNLNFDDYLMQDKWSTCANKSPISIQNEMIYAARKRDPDTFIKCLNELEGNCCIQNINQLDDD